VQGEGEGEGEGGSGRDSREDNNETMFVIHGCCLLIFFKKISVLPCILTCFYSLLDKCK